MQFSANLGLLWTDLPLPRAIRAAAAAGFDAVECHWPYQVPVAEVRAALEQTGLPMLGLNTRRGDAERAEFGLAALPHRETDAQAAIDQAIDYAVQVRAQSVHVMAGIAQGDLAQATFLENLRYACSQAKPHDLTILIEPLNPYDVPGYALQTTGQAARIIDTLALPNLKLMFDCYHVGRSEGDVLARLQAHLAYIGHIQFASVPDRGPPDHGAVRYDQLFKAIQSLGWTRPLGAEYKPNGPTTQSLGWLDWAKSI